MEPETPLRKGVDPDFALFTGEPGQEFDVVMEARRRGVGGTRPEVGIPAGVGEIKLRVQAMRVHIAVPLND